MNIPKNNIVFYSSSFLPVIGGLQYMVKFLLDEMEKELENELISKKYKFYFITTNKDSLPYLDYKNIKSFYLYESKEKKQGIIKTILKLKKILNLIKPDFIHTYSIFPDSYHIYLLNLFKWSKYRYITTSHGLDLTVVKDIGYGMRIHWYMNMLAKLITKQEYAHQVPSKAMADFCIELGLPNEKIFVIPNGIPNELPCKAKHGLINTLKKKHNIKDDDLVMLSLSGMRPIKGLTYLIDGFAKAYKQDKKIKLLLACEGDFLKELKDRVKKIGLNDNILFIGFVSGEEKEAYFEIANVFCMPSIFESFGIALVEAMSRGKICIATNTGGMSDIIKDNYNGFLVSIKSSDEIANKILFINDHKNELGEIIKNAKNTSERYKIKNIMPQLIEMYNKCCR